mgnify:CR=1 FL=1
MSEKLILKNKKAFFDYEIVEQFEAGIALSGGEVKSIKNSRVDFKGSYVAIKGGQPILQSLHVSPYQLANQPDYDPIRDRKLLLKKSEIEHLEAKSTQEGLTIIPLEIVLKSGLVKVKVGLGKGRKKYDKREVLKKRSMQREIEQSRKYG